MLKGLNICRNAAEHFRRQQSGAFKDITRPGLTRPLPANQRRKTWPVALSKALAPDMAASRRRTALRQLRGRA
jgi:hypothetical protein